MMFENRFKTSLFYSILVHGLIIVILAFTGIFTMPEIQDKIVEISLLEPMGGHAGGAIEEQIEEVQVKSEIDSIVEKKEKILKPKPKVIKKVVQKKAKVSKKTSKVMVGKVLDNPGNEASFGMGNGKGIGSGDGKGTGFGDGDGMDVAVQPPKIIKHKTPKYPSIAKRNGVEGVTHIKILIDSVGKVEDVIIAKSSGSKLLDNAAIKAVKKWKFISAKNKDGHAIRCYASMPIVFRIKK